MSYKKALERLKAIPSEQQLLASGTYKFFDDNGNAVCGCAIGKILPKFYQEISKSDSIKDAGVDDLFEYIEERNDEALTQEFKELKMSNDEFSHLQDANDKFLGRTSDRNYNEDNTLEGRQARYKYVISWLEESLALMG